MDFKITDFLLLGTLVLRPFRDAMSMIADLHRVSPWIDRWGAALNVPQFVGGLIFWRQEFGLMVAGACLITLIIAGQIHRAQPFSRLTSLSHVIWLPLLPALIGLLSFGMPQTPYEYWLFYVVVTMTICLLLDAANLILYVFRRDRFLADPRLLDETVSD